MPARLALALLRASRKGFSFVRPPFTPPLQLTHTRVAQAGVPCYLQCYRDATVEEGEGELFSFSFPFGARCPLLFHPLVYFDVAPLAFSKKSKNLA